MSASEPPVGSPPERRLVIVSGEEGAGKFLVELLVAKDVRDHRRVTRSKPTTQEWRDRVDLIPDDLSIRQAAHADLRYVGIDTTRLDVEETVRRVKSAIPEIYDQSRA